MTEKQPKEPSFETSLQTLTDIVESLEKGDLDLAAALEKFETGIKLTQHCQSALKLAEQKVQQLVGNDDSFQLTDFNSSES